MSRIRCSIKSSCTGTAVIASAIIGVLTAFAQITGVITVTPVFIWILSGITVAYLGVFAAAVAVARKTAHRRCLRSPLGALLLGILGTLVLSLVLLAMPIAASGVLSVLLPGFLLFFFTLTLTAAPCFLRCLADCETNE
jgi:hypothetical protein